MSSIRTVAYPGAPLNILLTGVRGGEFREIVLGLKFWPKGMFFWICERCRDFLGHEKNTGIFLDIIIFISSNQQ